MTDLDQQVILAQDLYVRALLSVLAASSSHAPIARLETTNGSVDMASETGIYHARFAHQAALEIVRLNFGKGTYDEFVRRLAHA